MEVSIILPTYNEAGNINTLIQSIYLLLGLKRKDIEFIVVDDNSPDDTQRIVTKLINKKIPVKLIVRKKTRGLATAILTGIKKARGKFLVLMDADFSHRPEDVSRLIKEIQISNADLVIGSRYLPGGGMHFTEANKLQFFLSKWGNFMVNRCLLNLPVTESLSGFLIMRRDVLSNLNLKKIFFGYGDYCIRLLFYLHRQGYKIKEIPVMYDARHYGQSKSNLLKMSINYLLTALKLKLQ